MQRIGDRLGKAGAVALALALVPGPLLAQSANDWRLPGATVRPAPPGSQGPVDGENPVVTTTAPRATQTATPSPSPSARPTASAAPSPTPSATPAPRRTAAPAPQAAPTAAPSTDAPGTVSTPPATAVPAVTPLPASLPASPALPPVAAAPAPEPSRSAGYWPWIAGAAALLAIGFAGLWWWRRSENSVPVITFERPVVQPKQPAPKPVAPASAPAPAPAPAPQPEPAPTAAPVTGLGMALEVRRMNASLMATSLNYVLKLTNHGAEPLSALAVEGDMVSAHASLPPEAQIANDNHRMEPRHKLVTLAPGESAEFTGVFMLPLTAVTPIRAGDAAYFVPLARLRVEASTPSGASLVQAQTWVVGELPEDAASALKPFRLDLGPRTYSRVGQRSVN